MPPVGAAVAAIGTAIGGAISAVSAFAGASFIGSLIVNTAVSVGLSLVARALAPKPKIEQRGIQTAVTTTGGTTPQAFILGRTATAGHHVCPPMSHNDGGTPNGFLTYVIELSDIPGIDISRVILNDSYSEIGTTAHVDYGYPLLGQRVGGKDHAWISFHDGTQTSADSMLVAKYGNYPDRPWSLSHIGTGTAYAVLTFRYNREIYNSLPQLRFEVDGIALYDPRFDSSVGGSGTQRWSDPASWARSANPAVMIYNILRGIRLPSGDIWGGDVPAEDLPRDNWFAAMIACDALVGGRPSFAAGLEIKMEMDPAEVIDELAKTCLGQLSEMGGVFRLRIGAPAAPVQFITDEDIVISEPQELDPFPGLAASTNAMFGEHPEPQSLWMPRAAPPLLNPAWEAEDGGRRLPTSLTFPACPNLSQVAQLMSAYAKDARRFRVHRMVLPPEAFLLEPLDTIAWTSERNGYASKIFEVVEIIDQPGTINQEILLRERDPSDYSWSSDDDLPTPIPINGLAPRPAQLIEGWTVTPETISDGAGLVRRPAIRLGWTGTAAEDATIVRFEVRLTATTALVTSGLADRSAGTALMSDGLLPATAYQARGRYVAARPTAWSAWLDVTTPDVFLNDADFEGGIRGLFEDAGLSAPEIVATLPATGNFQGRLVFLTSDNKLYRWTGSAWTAEVPAVDVTGQITGTQIADAAVTTAKFAQGLRPVEIVSALPGLPHIEGRQVFLTTDDKLYRNTGSGWTAAVASGDITGQLTNAQIATLAASKVTGQLTNSQIAGIQAAKIAGQLIETQIADSAISAAKIAANAVTAVKISAGAVETAKLAAGAVVTDKLAANAVTAAKISAGAVETPKLAAGAVETDKLAANAVTAAKVAANAVTADKVAANAITTAKIAAGAVTATEIAANAVTARHLVLADWENLVPDGDFLSPESWDRTQAPGWYFVVAGPAFTGINWARAPATQRGSVWSLPFSVEQGQEYFFSAEARRDGTGADGVMSTRVQWQDRSGTLISYSDPIIGSGITGGYQKFSRSVTAPSAAKQARIHWYCNAGSIGDVIIGAPSLRRKNGGELIVDGAVTANKIAANTITGGLLAASGIITNSAQINNTLITSAKIGNLQVSRIKIATGAVTTFDLIQSPVTFNGQTTYGSDALIGSHSVTLSTNTNLVPERFIFRPRISGAQPVVLSLASGQFGCYYRIRIKRNRSGTISELGTYIEPFWEFTTDGTRMNRVIYAGVRPSAVVQITQSGSYQAGDKLIFEFYWHRSRSGSVNAAVDILSYDLEVEEYFR